MVCLEELIKRGFPPKDQYLFSSVCRKVFVLLGDVGLTAPIMLPLSDKDGDRHNVTDLNIKC
jgi:hypothetical protein